MSIAEQAPPRANGRGLHWPGRDAFENFARSPQVRIPRKGKPALRFATDRVRARPAITPTISGALGVTAIGLGLWGLLAPRSVSRAFGLSAGKAAVVTLFGAREIASGYGLASDPTKAGWLWFRLAGDLFDLAVLKSADRPDNPHRGAARFALKAVLLVAAMDAVTGARMSTVVRNCVSEERR